MTLQDWFATGSLQPSSKKLTQSIVFQIKFAVSDGQTENAEAHNEIVTAIKGQLVAAQVETLECAMNNESQKMRNEECKIKNELDDALAKQLQSSSPTTVVESKSEHTAAARSWLEVRKSYFWSDVMKPSLVEYATFVKAADGSQIGVKVESNDLGAAIDSIVSTYRDSDAQVVLEKIDNAKDMGIHVALLLLLTTIGSQDDPRNDLFFEKLDYSFEFQLLAKEWKPRWTRSDWFFSLIIQLVNSSMVGLIGHILLIILMTLSKSDWHELLSIVTAEERDPSKLLAIIASRPFALALTKTASESELRKAATIDIAMATLDDDLDRKRSAEAFLGKFQRGYAKNSKETQAFYEQVVLMLNKE